MFTGHIEQGWHQMTRAATATMDRTDGFRERLALVVVTTLLLAGAPISAFAAPVPPSVGARLAELFLHDTAGTHTVAVTLDTVPSPLSGPMAAAATLGLEAQGFVHLPVMVVRGPVAALESLAFVPGVRGMWLDTPLEQVMAESREVIGVDTVQQELGLTGAGVAIAVLDSGIEATHPDLEFGSKTVQNVKVVGAQGPGYSGPLTALAQPVEDVPDTDLTTGHGTHVAGIAAGDGTASSGRLRGVASGADLVGISVGDAYLVTTLAGYDWLLGNHVEYGIRVLNNSWADSGIAYDEAHPLNVASRTAVDAGIVVVQAAGNDGQASGDVYNRYAAPWVIGVGGVDKLGRLGSYSARGTAERHVDVMAPGSFIASTMAKTGLTGAPNQTPFDLTDPAAPRMLQPQEMPYYTVKVGSSMAAPHVAGLAALLLEANPALTPAQVKDVIVATAAPIAGCLVIDCGAGLVNAGSAVAAAQLLGGPVLQAPVAALTATPSAGQAPLATTLDASASSDADGVVVGWEWDLDGDGDIDSATTVPTLAHTFAAGRHTVAVTALDDDGLRSVPATTQVVASDPPHAQADAPTKAYEDEDVVLDASGSTDVNGDIVSYRFDLGDGRVIEQTEPVLSTRWSVEHHERFAWVVTVVDDAGLTDSVGGTIKIKRVHD